MSPELIIAAIQGGIQLITLATKAAEDLKQSGEMTQAESDAFDAQMKAAFASATQWQPEA